MDDLVLTFAGSKDCDEDNESSYQEGSYVDVTMQLLRKDTI